MLRVSDLLIEHREVQNFEEFVEVVKLRARGEFFFRMDLKPPFFDTPVNWEEVLEAAFTSYQSDAE